MREHYDMIPAWKLKYPADRRSFSVRGEHAGTMDKTMRALFEAVMPVIIHFAATSFLAMAGEAFFPGMDAGTRVTGVTVLSAVLCIPLFCAMYSTDLKRGRFPAGERRESEKLQRQIVICLLCLTAGGACSAAAGLIMRASGLYRFFSNDIQEMLLNSPLLLQLFGIGLAVPVCEEFLYRGLVYGRVRSMIPRGWAVCICSLLFAAGHGNVIQAMYAFPMALILTVLYERDRSLTAPVLFHIGANMLTVAMHILGIAAG